MMAAKIWRPLTPIEIMYSDRDVFTGFAVRTTGRLNLAALQTAYESVCRSYPPLTARLKIDDAGLVFAESAARFEIQIGTGDPENPLIGVELDQRRVLSALSVVRDGFNLVVDRFHDGLEHLADWLTPEPQARGRFRKEYESTTFRGNLGLEEA